MSYFHFFHLVIFSTLGIEYHPEIIGKLEKYLEFLTDGRGLSTLYCNQVGLYCYYCHYFSASVKSKDLKTAKLIQNCFLKAAGNQSCFSGRQKTKHRKNKEKQKQKMHLLFSLLQTNKDFCYPN